MAQRHDFIRILRGKQFQEDLAEFVENVEFHVN